MCIITALATAGAAIGTAVSGFLSTSLIATTAAGGVALGTGAAGAAVAAGGTSVLTVGGALAGVALASTAAIGLTSMYKQARASAKAQQAQADAIKKLEETNNAKLEVNQTANGIQNGARINRTLSSLRVSMLPQQQNKDEITQNVYGVDSNTVATSTQNMTGLNIAIV